MHSQWPFEEARRTEVTESVARARGLVRCRLGAGGWLLAAVAAFWLGLVWLWDAGYLALAYDDAYYYLRTVANLARGHGATFDQVNTTNGFHPLWLLLVAGLSLIVGEDPAHLMRWMLTVQALLVIAGLILLSTSFPRAGGWIVALGSLLVATFYGSRALVSGMESGLQFAVLAAGLAFSSLDREKRASTTGAAVVRGVLGGLATLARVEAVVFGLVLVTLPLLWPAGCAAADRRQRVRGAVLGLAAMAACLAPYVAWSWLEIGHLTPVSGAIKASYGVPLWVRYGAGVSVAAAAVFAAAPLVVWFRLRRGVSPEALWLLRTMAPLVAYLAFLVAYNLFARASLMLDSLWYLVPHLVLAIVVGGVLLQALAAKRWGRWLTRAAVGVLSVAVLASWARVGFHPDRVEIRLAARRSGEWIAATLPEDALGAGWDIGIVAAHSRRRVMNLEGLINSWDFKDRYLDKGRVGLYVDEIHRVDFIAQRVFLEGLSSSGSSISGVDFSDWWVARSECVSVPRSILRPGLGVVHPIHLVLTRERIVAGPRYSALDGAACSGLSLPVQ